MIEHFYAVVMAGGGGTRLWPLSRQARPKQMVSLDGQKSLFQIAIERLEGLFPPARILVVTVASQAEALQAQCPQLKAENFLLEPKPRSTASVVGLAAVALRLRDPQAVMAVVTADHVIQNVERFLQVLEAGCQVARQDWLVTLGIAPTFPSTGYGYIQTGESLGQYNGVEGRRGLAFKEKPDAETAARFIAGGDHYWNSGMFIWKCERILSELARSMPALAAALERIGAAWNTKDRQDVLEREWETLVPVSIDYGVMEKASQVAVLPASDLGWSDVGSWDSLYDFLPADEHKNIPVSANWLSLDTKSTLVYSQDPKRLIVTIGVEDLIVVDTGDALLICPRSEAQKVRQAVAALKETKRENYL